MANENEKEMKPQEPEKESADDSPIDAYEVGYRKPPKHTRFQSGQSGNPRGRPKGTKNLKTDLAEELSEKIVIREGDRPKRISKQRALVKSLVNGSIKGNARTTTPLLSMILRLTDTGEGAPELDDVLHDDELEILREFKNRTKREMEATAKAPSADRSDGEEDPS